MSASLFDGGVAVLESLTVRGILSASVLDGGAFVLTTTTLETCAVGVEGLVRRDAAGGGTTGERTRICICTSDGAPSPAYAWINLGSGTVGTTTACNP